MSPQPRMSRKFMVGLSWGYFAFAAFALVVLLLQLAAHNSLWWWWSIIVVLAAAVGVRYRILANREPKP